MSRSSRTGAEGRARNRPGGVATLELEAGPSSGLTRTIQGGSPREPGSRSAARPDWELVASIELLSPAKQKRSRAFSDYLAQESRRDRSAGASGRAWICWSEAHRIADG